MDKLQWGKRKRLRVVKVVKDSSVLGEKSAASVAAAGVGDGDGAVRKKITSPVVVGSAAADANRQIYPPPLPPIASSSQQQREEKGGGERMDKLQWGKRKRMRCVKVVKDSSVLGGKSAASVAAAGVGDGAVRKKITSTPVVGSAAADANRQIYPPPLSPIASSSQQRFGEDEQIKFERQHESGNNSVVTGERRSILSNSGGSIGLDHDNEKLFTEPKEGGK